MSGRRALAAHWLALLPLLAAPVGAQDPAPTDPGAPATEAGTEPGTGPAPPPSPEQDAREGTLSPGAADRPLFFTPREIQDLTAAIDDTFLPPQPLCPDPANPLCPPEGEAVVTLPVPNLYLAGIVYRGPQDWSIWFDDGRIDAGDEVPNDLRILAVGPAGVRLDWSPPEAAGRTISAVLRTRQTLVGEGPEIVEGRVPDPEPPAGAVLATPAPALPPPPPAPPAAVTVATPPPASPPAATPGGPSNDVEAGGVGR